MILAFEANSKTPYMLHFFAGFRTFWWRLVIEKIWKYTRAGISRKMGLKGQVETGIFLNFLQTQLGEKVFWIFHQNFCKKSIFNSPLKTHYHLASSIYVPITRSLTTSFRRSGMMMKIYASTTYYIPFSCSSSFTMDFTLPIARSIMAFNWGVEGKWSSWKARGSTERKDTGLSRCFLLLLLGSILRGSRGRCGGRFLYISSCGVVGIIARHPLVEYDGGDELGMPTWPACRSTRPVLTGP